MNAHCRPEGTDSVKVEIWDQGLVSSIGWRDLRDGRKGDASQSSADYKRFLYEEHHHLYGRPWCIGRTYLDYLVKSGLQPADKVLDFGCGAGRLGIWLINFLESGRYVGVDHHWMAIDAFASYEIPFHGLAAKRPRLVLDGSLGVVELGEAFDVILDCFVSFHLGGPERLKLYRGFAEVLRPGGRIFLPHVATLDKDSLSSLGLVLVHEQVVKSEFLVAHFPEAKAQDHWHVIQKK